MNRKLATKRLSPRAVGYVRQPSPGRVIHHLESRCRQYRLGASRCLPHRQLCATHSRSGFGLMNRPPFSRLANG